MMRSRLSVDAAVPRTASAGNRLVSRVDTLIERRMASGNPVVRMHGVFEADLEPPTTHRGRSIATWSAGVRRPCQGVDGMVNGPSAAA